MPCGSTFGLARRADLRCRTRRLQRCLLRFQRMLRPIVLDVWSLERIIPHRTWQGGFHCSNCGKKCDCNVPKVCGLFFFHPSDFLRCCKKSVSTFAVGTSKHLQVATWSIFLQNSNNVYSVRTGQERIQQLLVPLCPGERISDAQRGACSVAYSDSSGCSGQLSWTSGV